MRRHYNRVDLTRALAAFGRDERGATAVEYGLLVAGISLAIVAAVAVLGTNIGGVFNRVSNGLTHS